MPFVELYVPIKVVDTHGIVEWGECLPDCPQETVDKVCIMEPEFPAVSTGSSGTANFTSNYHQGSGMATLDVSFQYRA